MAFTKSLACLIDLLYHKVLIMKKTNTLVLYFWNAMNTKMA